MQILSFVASFFLILSGIPDCSPDRLEISKSLLNYLGVLEPYEHTQNDIVFVLDESGSIGLDNFLQVLAFTELIARHLIVSENFSRLAVLTYSNAVRLHIDNIEQSDDENMCTLLSIIRNINYAEGGTHTGEALETAFKILQNARARTGEVHRIIILLTDGQSNGYVNPIRVATRIKNEQGIIIFTVGVADINEEELNGIASSPGHIYILKKLSDIKTVNEYLESDTTEFHWDRVEEKFCETCDAHASCFCGTKGGKYECACKEGYHGSGHKGSCQLCPKGTYKHSAGPHVCTHCPHNSTTQRYGSTSMTECDCIVGHEGNPKAGQSCTPAVCAKLPVPRGSVLLPSECGYHYGSKCNFKCLEGFCPYSCKKTSNNVNNLVHPWNVLPNEPRQCLQTGKWTGVDFHCEEIVCPPLVHPKNGVYNCTNFTMNSVCRLSCNRNFQLSGSEKRTCGVDRTWSGEEGTCVGIQCKPLKTDSNLNIKPKTCAFEGKDFGTVCQYYCKKGYTLSSKLGNKSQSLGIRECLLRGKWSNFFEELTCVDSQPPTITCPLSPIISFTDPGRSTAQISWEYPSATDNQAIRSVDIIHPKQLRAPYNFPIGPTKVVYKATDYSGLFDTCSFAVIVTDNEPPKALSCIDVEKRHDKNTQISVTWNEPRFVDNSGKVSVGKPNRESGSKFKWGKESLVIYTARDPSGNVGTCSFYVVVKPYVCQHAPPPSNGLIACDLWSGGQFCSVSCKTGYAFISEPETVYYCHQNTRKWGRLPGKVDKPFIFPWPDCSEKKDPKGFNISIHIIYGVSKCTPKDIMEAKANFIEALKKKHSSFCPQHKGCHIDNVNITCEGQTRQKRSSDVVHKTREISKFNLHISLSVISNSTADLVDTCTNCDDAELSKSFYDIGSNVTDALIPSVTEFVKDTIDSNSVHRDINHAYTFICEAGQISTETTCVNCPVGTYFNSSSRICEVCPVGYYQDKEAQMSCKSCPSIYLTLRVNAKGVEDCRTLCRPGTYSSTGLEPCKPCEIGKYQEEWASSYCLECPQLQSTAVAGANSLSYCLEPCEIGSFSENGLPPCSKCQFGTYQGSSRQTSCNKCPLNTTTVMDGAHSVDYCRTVNHCVEFEPCANGAACHNVENGYECVCLPGFEGKDCLININDCDLDTCENNATCIDGIQEFSCKCLPGFSGFRCEQDIDDCDPDPCLNGGTCTDLVNDHTCECKPGFTGNNCQNNIDDCQPNPCANDGKCFDMENDFRCCCKEGYTGNFCEQLIDYCQDVKCGNDGECSATTNGTICKCKGGFSGKFCEVNIDDCSPNLCLNGGTCVDQVNKASCVCYALYGGDHCEKELPTSFTLNFPTESTMNYVSLDVNQRLRAITVSFILKKSISEADGIKGTPISYGYINPRTGVLVDNALTLMYTNKFLLFLNGQSFHTGVDALTSSSMFIVITWESKTGSFAFYINEGLMFSENDVAKSGYLYPGIFILGQEQDSLGGTFSKAESYVGDITEFNVWDYAFTHEEVGTLMCQKRGNILSWPAVVQNMHGNISVVYEEDSERCSEYKICPIYDEIGGENCHCFSSSETQCSHFVEQCNENACEHNQECLYDKNTTIAYCNCSDKFEGRNCEYDVDECLDNNGHCSHICTNTVGSHSCSCPEGMKLLDDNKTCFDITICKHDGQVFLHTERWTSSCQNRLCLEGEVVSTPVRCYTLYCKSWEIKVKLPGACCETCVDKGNTCVLNSNSTVTTFDSMSYEFHGNCHYTVAKDCIDSFFSIESVMSEDPAKSNIVLHFSCTNFTISMQQDVLVDSEKVTLPYRDDAVSINRDDFGNLIVWSFNNVYLNLSSERTEIGLPNLFKKKVCGLCGNMNGKASDDISVDRHFPGRKLEAFTNSWKSKKNCDEDSNNILSNRHLKIPTHTQIVIKTDSLNLAFSDPTYKRCWIDLNSSKKRICRVFWNKHFQNCHKFVDPDIYYVICLMDMCNCPPNHHCYCDSVLEYVSQCLRFNVSIQHVAATKACDYYCQNTMVYDDCKPACPTTCDEYLNSSKNTCSTSKCVQGCHCPTTNGINGVLLFPDVCVPQTDCSMLKAVF